VVPVRFGLVPEHPKTLALCAELMSRWPTLISAGSGLGRNAMPRTDGFGISSAAIRGRAEVHGPGGELVSALVKVGFLDDENEWFLVHDWQRCSQDGRKVKERRGIEEKEARQNGRQNGARRTPKRRAAAPPTDVTDGP